jgi:alkylation response protein AidB-like acyl-CoA dehydrogenase
MNVDTEFEEGAAGVSSIKRDMERLIAFARQADYHGDVLWNDALFRAKAATLQAELDALEHMLIRATQEGEDTGSDLALLVRMSGSELRQKVSELIVEALGPFGLAQDSVCHDDSGADAPPAAIEAPGAAPTLAFRHAAAIDDGTIDVRREIIAGTSPRISGAKGDSGLSEDDAMLRASIDHFTAAEYDAPKRAVLLADNRDHWGRFAALGWLGIGIPEDAGGHGGSLAATMIVAERLGRGLAVEPFTGSIVYTSQVLQTLLDAPAAAKLLAPAVAGRIRLAMACHEAPARGGLRWTSAKATPDKGDYVLDGCKVAVAGGGVATDYLVSARTAGDVYDPFGHSLFLVPRDMPGLKVRAWRMIDGSDMAAVEMDGVRVPAEALLGKPGAALGALSAGMDATIVASAFGTVGAMEAVLAATAGQLREPFDGPPRDLRFLRHHYVDMLAELEQARSAAMLGLASLLQPDARRRAYATSATKAVVARASGVVCSQALRLQGEMGVTEKMRLGHLSSFMAASNSLRGSLDFHLSRMSMFM